MPYPPLKTESYQNLGGINNKASPYDLGAFEFADISNMDFFVPGSLRQRPGSGTFITGFSNLYLYSGVTQVPKGPINGMFEFSSLAGGTSSPGYSFLIFTSQPAANLSSGQTLSNIWKVQGNILQSVTLNQSFFWSGALPPIGPSFHTSFLEFNNALFMADGNAFYKWDGISGPVGQYDLPQPPILSVTYSQGNFGVFARSPFTFNTATISYAYVDQFGFIGPASTFYMGTSLAANGVTGWNVTFYQTLITCFDTVVGSTISFPGFICPGGYNIGTTVLNNFQGFTSTSPSCFVFYSNGMPDSNGPNTQRISTLLSISGYSSNIVAPNDMTLGNFYCPAFTNLVFPTIGIQQAGTTLLAESIVTGTPEPTCISFTLAPKYLEVFQNQMFMAGFSQSPSTVAFSDIGLAESVQPESNFDVRTNDGDVISAMKSFFYQLFIFKRNSFSVLSGTDSSNFFLQQVTDQYGCISGKALVSYRNNVVFLDKKGIAQYNGAYVSIISDKVEQLFLNMNITAAYDNAWMIHNKPRNQIWCGIPVNGSTLINQIVVYDYLINAWSHFDGNNIDISTMAYQGNAFPQAFVGGYSGVPGYMSSSLMSDYGATIQMSWWGRWISEQGQSIEKMFRRLYINHGSANGATIQWNVNLYSNYSSLAPAATFQLTGQSYQIRYDFGVSTKALSVQAFAATNSDIYTLFGFTIEARFQRAV
jgi:hypothetical protein